MRESKQQFVMSGDLDAVKNVHDLNTSCVSCKGLFLFTSMHYFPLIYVFTWCPLMLLFSYFNLTSFKKELSYFNLTSYI